MTLDEQVDLLNTLSEPTPEQLRRLTLDEVRELVKNPPKRPRSIPMEQAMAATVEAFRNGDRSTTSKLTKYARREFLGHAARMSVEAVRQNNSDLIEQGLVALIMESGGGDWRDSIIALFQLYHSAVKIGMDAQAAITKIAELAEPCIIKKEMAAFPQRLPASRSLKAFCMEEENPEIKGGDK